MTRTACSLLFVACLFCGCADSHAPNAGVRYSIPPKPTIYVRTADGVLVPEVAEAQDDNRDFGVSNNSQTDINYQDDSRWRSGDGLPEAERLRYSRPVSKGSSPIDAGKAEPIYPQTYYVRPEHTSKGYIEGRYGRIENFTPGEHTSTEYIPGHYRGDGLYTRPEHTPPGYIPGHYRAVPQPGNPASQIGAGRP